MNWDQKQLLKWFKENHRELPWRASRDPYKVWIAEVMLQQTTSAAVIPYFQRFLKKFPTLKHLAKADISEVIEAWAGLGYYSRARNLHRASQFLAQGPFPQSYQELLELPGFGPYTARSVTSLAFNENVGVVDGNVIRVLSRRWNRDQEWWGVAGRSWYQSKSDELVAGASSREINEALMDLGATICTPTNPKCILCPWIKKCEARQAGTIASRPISKPKKQREIWIWEPVISLEKNKILLVTNTYAPFLKGQWLLPGKVKLSTTKPKNYLYKHTITHHDIYVLKVQNKVSSKVLERFSNQRWVKTNELSQVCPVNLVQKALKINKIV